RRSPGHHLRPAPSEQLFSSWPAEIRTSRSLRCFSQSFDKIVVREGGKIAALPRPSNRVADVIGVDAEGGELRAHRVAAARDRVRGYASQRSYGGALRLGCQPQIPFCLAGQPRFGRGIRQPADADRHIGGNRRAPVQDTGELDPGHTKPASYLFDGGRGWKKFPK